MATTHTPGPWTVKQGSDERDFIVAEPGGNTVCEPNIDCFDFTELEPSVRTIRLEEAKANAYLIASAPGLLKVARASWHLCQSLLAMRSDATDHLVRAVSDALAAEIAKAEGRS